MRNIISIILILSFFLTSVIGPALGQGAVALNLPKPGAMIGLSESFAPVVLKGVSIHRDDPLLFDFIVDAGDSGLNGQKLTDETTKLVKYFLAGLAVPEQDLWVNLSPAEKDRIMAEPLSHTDVGRDMLTQDYILKQVTATLMYPEKDLGRKFWDEIYRQVHAQLGDRDVPVDTFNKVWITPDEAEVYQHEGQAFVTKAHLKVMLESDYLAMSNNRLPTRGHVAPFVNVSPSADITKNALRAIIIPILEKEVNEGKNFAALRQIFHSLILAGWYKRAMKESLLSQVYAGTNKIDGIDIAEKNARQKVYARYLEAYRRGVYNYVKDEFDQATRETLPRKYFSGGIVYDRAMNPDFAADSAGVKVDHGQVQQYRLGKRDHSMRDSELAIQNKYPSDFDLPSDPAEETKKSFKELFGHLLVIFIVSWVSTHLPDSSPHTLFLQVFTYWPTMRTRLMLWLHYLQPKEQNKPLKLEFTSEDIESELEIFTPGDRTLSDNTQQSTTSIKRRLEVCGPDSLHAGYRKLSLQQLKQLKDLLSARLKNSPNNPEKIRLFLREIMAEIASRNQIPNNPFMRKKFKVPNNRFGEPHTKKAPGTGDMSALINKISPNTGGIDLGQGDYLKVVGTDAAGMVRVDRAEILRLQKDLRGFVPIPVGNPYPVKPGMFPAVPSVAPSS